MYYLSLLSSTIRYLFPLSLTHILELSSHFLLLSYFFLFPFHPSLFISSISPISSFCFPVLLPLSFTFPSPYFILVFLSLSSSFYFLLCPPFIPHFFPALLHLSFSFFYLNFLFFFSSIFLLFPPTISPSMHLYCTFFFFSFFGLNFYFSLPLFFFSLSW